MLNARLYLDYRRPNKKGEGQLRVVVTKNGTSSMMSLGICLKKSQWKNGLVVNHPDAKLLNGIISAKKGAIDRQMLELSTLGVFVGKKAPEIVSILKDTLEPDAKKRKRAVEDERSNPGSILNQIQQYCQQLDNNGTRQLYMDTHKKIESYCSSLGQDAHSLTFDSITKDWLGAFEKFCKKTQRQNTASRHLRDIRAIFNYAIDKGITTNYPFRKFKIKREETFDKSFSATELRSLFSYPCYPGGEQESVDILKLLFLLIGINSVDLAYATKEERGRLNYIRRKTHKCYSVKLEPEAVELIQKYSGSSYLVNILERYPNYKTYFNRMGKTLRKIGKTRIHGKKSVGKAILPNICTGSARTSWATIAQEELDIPRDVIAAALGHHTVDVTSTYLRTDWRKKVDAANRKVIDWVLYNKR
jgi:integrase